MDYFSFDLQLFAGSNVTLRLAGITVSDDGKFSGEATDKEYKYEISTDKKSLTVSTVGDPTVELGTFTFMEKSGENFYLSFKAAAGLAGVLGTDGTIKVVDNEDGKVFMNEADYSLVTANGIKINVSENTNFHHLKDTSKDDTITFNDSFGWWEEQGGNDTVSFKSSGTTATIHGGGINTTWNMNFNLLSEKEAHDIRVKPFTSLTFSNTDKGVIKGDVTFKDDGSNAAVKIPKLGVIALAGDGTIEGNVTFDGNMIITKAPSGGTWAANKMDKGGTGITFAEALSYTRGDYYETAEARAEYTTADASGVALTADIEAKGTNNDLVLNDVTVKGSINLGGGADTLQLNNTSAVNGGISFTGTSLTISGYTGTDGAGTVSNDANMQITGVALGGANATVPGALSAKITGGEGTNALVIDSTNRPIAVTGDIDLGAGDDTLTFTTAENNPITVTGEILLGAGNDSVTVGGGAKVTVSKGITGGAGNNSYDFSGAFVDAVTAANSTSIKINDFKAGDSLNIGKLTITTKNEDAQFGITAGQDSFTLDASHAGVYVVNNNWESYPAIESKYLVEGVTYALPESAGTVTITKKTADMAIAKEGGVTGLAAGSAFTVSKEGVSIAYSVAAGSTTGTLIVTGTRTAEGQTEVYTWNVPAGKFKLQAGFSVDDKTDGTRVDTIKWADSSEGAVTAQSADTTTKYLSGNITPSDNDNALLKIADQTTKFVYGDGTTGSGAQKYATLGYDATNTKYTLTLEADATSQTITLTNIKDYNVVLTDSRSDKTAETTIAGLVSGKSVEMVAATTGSTLKFDEIATFAGVTGGVVFTAGADAAAFRAALGTAKDAVTVAGKEIVLTAKAQADAGIAVDKSGAVSGLNDGDAFTVNGVAYSLTKFTAGAEKTLAASGALKAAVGDTFTVAGVAYAVTSSTGTVSGITHTYKESGKDELALAFGANNTEAKVVVTPSGENATATTYKLIGQNDETAEVVMNRANGTVELFVGKAELTSTAGEANGSLTGKIDANGEAVTITANKYTVDDEDRNTTVTVTAANGLITTIGDFDTGESITIGEYTYVKGSGDYVSRYKTSEGASTAVQKEITEYSTLANLTANAKWLDNDGVFTVEGYPALDLSNETLAAALATKVVTLKRNPVGEEPDKIPLATLEKNGNTYTLTRTSYTQPTEAAVQFEITAPTGATLITSGFTKAASESPEVPADSLKLNLAAGNTATVNGVGYKAAADAVLSIDDTAAGKATLDSGSLSLVFDGSTNTANTAEKGSVVLVSGSANTALTVTADGVISGLKAGDIFTVSNENGTTDYATRYEVAADGKSITATNGFIGTYAVTDLTKVTIASNLSGPDTVAEDSTALKAANGALTVALNAITGDVKSILVKATVVNGVITGYTTATSEDEAPTVASAIADNAVVGYFTMSTTSGVTTVTYTGNEAQIGALGTTAVLNFNGVEPGTTVKYATSTALPGSAVSATNLAAGTNVAGIENGVAYTPKYVLASDAKTLTLKDLSVGSHYFAVTTADAGKGVFNCSIATTETASADHAGTNYFVVTVTQATATTKTYDVSYLAASGTGKAIAPDATWTGITVDASALTKDGTASVNGAASVNVTPTGEGKETYSITNLNAGVKNNADSSASVTAAYANGTYAIVYQTSTGTVLTNLPLETDAVYEVSSTNVAGEITILIKDLNNASAETTTATKAYLKISGNSTATVKVEYIPNSTGIKLTGLTEKFGTADTGEKLYVTFDGSGLNNNVTAVNIYDGEPGSATRTDYDLQNLPGGVAVQYATTGEDTSDYDYTYKNGIEIALADLGTNTAVYYTVVQKSVKDGVVTYGVGEASTTKPTDNSANYFTVEAVDNDAEKDGVAETIKITYTKATAEGKAIDLTATVAGGTATVDAANTGAAITKIDVTALETAVNTTSTTVTVNNVDKAVDVTQTSATVNYTTSYALATGSLIDLSQVAVANVLATPVYYKVSMADAATGHGVKEITIAKANSQGDAGTDYFVAYYTAKDAEKGTPAKVTLDYHYDAATSTITRAMLAAAGQIAVTGTVAADIITAAGDGGVTIELTKDSDGIVNYNVTAVSKEATVANVGEGDKVAYTESFIMGSADTITLGKTAGTVYLDVTATGGGVAEKGVWTVSIGSAIDVSSAGGDADKLAALLAKHNYITVTTSEQAISVAYTAATNPETGKPTIDLSKKGDLKVDASGISENVKTITIADDTTATNPKSYTINGVPETVATIASANVTTTASYAAVNSVVYTGATEIALGNRQDIVYYTVARAAGEKNTDGKVTTDKTGIVTYTVSSVLTQAQFEALAASAKLHYFKVDYSYSGIVTVNYVNADGDANFDLSKIGQQVKVRGTNLSSSVTKLDITDQTGAGVNYAVSQITHDVTVIGQGDGDTVEYSGYSEFAEGSAIALGNKAKAYYTLTATTETVGNLDKTTLTIGAASETEPTGGNYFVVEYDSTKGSEKYTVRYHKAEGTDAIDLEPLVAVPVDASGAATVVTIDIQNDTKGSAVRGYTLTGLPGGVTVDATGVSDGFTASYATSLDWTKGGTYYAAAETDGSYKLATGTTATIEAGKTYLAVTVTKNFTSEGVAEPDTLTFQTQTASNVAASKGYMNPTGTTATSKTFNITAPTAAWKLDLDSNANTINITGAAAGSVFTDVGSGTSITTATLEDGQKITLDKVDYVSAGGGVIEIGTDGKIVNGTVFVTDAATLSGSNTTDNDTITVVKGGGVTVTFEKGKIVSVKGLGKDEVITIGGTGSYAGTYTASADGLTITKDDGTKAGLSVENGEIVKGMTYSSGEYNVGVFSWTQDTTGSYLKVTDDKAEIVTTSTPGTVEYNASTPTYYIKTTVTIIGTVPNQTATLTLTPMVSNAAKLLNEAPDFAGTINITAPSAAGLVYTKGGKDAFTVNVTGAAAGSTFTGMAATDTIATAALASGSKVTVNGLAYTTSGSDAQTLTFDGKGVLTSAGVFTVDGTTAIQGTSQTVSLANNDSGVVVTFTKDTTTGAVTASSITGLTSTEEVTVANADGSKTVYSLSGGYLQKVVTDAAGNTTTSKTTTAATATTNILSDLPYGTGTISGTFAFDANATGYFVVSGTPATAALDTVKHDVDLSTDGKIYFVATNVYDETAKTNTLTMAAKKVSGGALVDATATDVAGVTLTIPVTSATKPVIFDQGTTFGYKVAVTDAKSFDEYKNLVSGSTVTTTNAATAVTVNGNLYVHGVTTAALVINSYGASGSKIYSGVAQIGGEYTGSDTKKHDAPTSVSSGIDTATATKDATATYSTTSTAAAGAAGNDGVMLTYANGELTVIDDIEVGESVAVAYPTETVVYTKKDTGSIWRETTTKAGVKTLAVTATTVGAKVTIGTTAFTENKAVSQFNWTTTKEEAATSANGYFLAKSSDGTVTIEKQTTATTIDFNDKGKIYAKVAISANNTIGATELTFVKINDVGKEEAVDPPTFLKTVNIAAPAAALNYTKAANVTYAVNVTGAIAGSTISSLASGDEVTTAALAASTNVQVNGKTYASGTTGTATTTMVIQGNGHVTSGIYGLTATNGTLTASVTDESSDEYPTTAQAITYTRATGTDGAVATVANGAVQSITGIGAGETVVIVETLTTRTGGTTDVSTTTYAAKANEADATKTDVTKTVLVNGTTTTYKKTYATDAAAIAADFLNVTDWTQDSIVVDGRLAWGGTGYYQATGATVSGVTTYTVASAVEAGQGINPITYDSSDDTNNYYLKAATSGDAIKGYTIDSFTIVKAQKNGELKEISGATIKGTIKITAPAAKLNLPAHTTYAIALNDAQATTYTGLNADDLITMAEGQNGTITVDGAAFKLGAAATASGGANYVQFTKSGKVTSGSFVMKAALDLQTGNGATVLHYSTASEAAADAAGNDGVVVVFANDNTVSSITDLEAKETVRMINTATGGDGETIVTTTTFTTEDGANITKTVETVTTYTDGTSTTETVVSKLAGATAATNVATAAFNTETTSAFDWTAKGGTGYFATVAGTPLTSTVVKQAAEVVINQTNAGQQFVKVTLGDDNVVKAINLVTVGATGGLAVDTTTAYNVAISGADLSGTITLPADKAGDASDGLGTITISNAKAGQVVSIVGDKTHGDAAYVAATSGDLVFSDTGMAKSGSFRATADAKTMFLEKSGTKKEITYGGSDATGAVVTVATDDLGSITGISAGESVTIKETDGNGNVTTRVFTGSDAGSGKILVTRVTTDPSGTSTTATYTFSSSDANIYSIDSSIYTDTGATLTSNFDGTMAKGSGYFTLSAAGAAAITGPQSGVAIADGTYVQVTPTADYTLTGQVVTVKEGKATVAADQTVLKSLTVAAPSENALTFAKTGSYTLAISGLAKDSVISNLRGGDTVATGALAKGAGVQINGVAYTAAVDKGTIEFVAEKVDATPANDVVAVKNGTLTLASGVAVRAMGATAADTTANDVTTYGGTDDTVVTYTLNALDTAAPTVKITNGVVESLDTSSLNGGTVAVAPTGGVTVTYGKLTAQILANALAAGTTVTTLALEASTTISNGTTVLGVSTTANEKFTFYGETGEVASIFEGSLAMTAAQANNTFRATGANKTAVTDDTVITNATADVVVKVAGGKVTSFAFQTAPASGATATATLTTGTGTSAVVTKYDVKDGQVTKTVTANGATTTSIAFVSDMTADLMGGSVRYAVTGDASDTDTDAAKLVGQFNWNLTSGRETGYFAVNANKSTVTVGDQPTEVAADLTKTGTTYLVAHVSDATGDDKTRTLTLTPKKVASNNLADDTFSGGKVTINAPTAYGMIYDNTGAAFNVTVANAAANSNVALRQGDMLTTASLTPYQAASGTTLAQAAQTITVNGDVYTAGAKGKLTFYGETNGTTEAPTYAAALYAGAVVLKSGTAISLAGSNQTGIGDTDDFTVTYAGAGDTPVLAVKAGKVSSISGLTVKDSTVTVTETSTKQTTIFKVLTEDGTMVQKQVFTDTDLDGVIDEGEAASLVTTFATIAKGKEVYGASYKAAATTGKGEAATTVLTSDLSWTNTAAATTGYFLIGDIGALTGKDADGNAAAVKDVTISTALNNMVSLDTVAAEDKAATATTPAILGLATRRGQYFLKVTAAKNASGVTKITAVDVMQVTSNGALKKVTDTYAGAMTLDGQYAVGTGTANGVISYTAPAAAKRSWTLAVTNLAANSVIANLTKTGDTLNSTLTAIGDTITVNGVKYIAAVANVALKIDGGTVPTVSGDGEFTMMKGATKLYVADAETSATITYSTVKDNVKVIVEGGAVTGITGLATNGEKLTVETVTTTGKITDTYSVANGTITRVRVAADGTTTTATHTAAADFDLIAGEFSTPVLKDVEYNFTWTTSGTTGYFVVPRNGNVAIKAVKGAIRASDANAYIAVALSADGVVESIKQVRMSGEGMVESGVFAGTLTLSVAKNTVLRFDRLNLSSESIADTTALAIAGVAAGSNIVSLAVGDTVSTAALAADASVTVNGSQFVSASKNNTMQFKVAADADGNAAVAVTGGKIALDGATVGDAIVKSVLVEHVGTATGPSHTITVGANSAVNVSVSTGKKGSTYAVEGLSNGETFTVSDGTTTTEYTMSNGTLLRTSDGGTTFQTFAIGKKTSVASGTILTGKWADGKAAFDEYGKLTNGGNLLVNLSAVDALISAAVKAKQAPAAVYRYVVDTNIAANTKANANITATAVSADASGVQTRVGLVDYTNFTYVAGLFPQTITVTKGWSVQGSASADFADTITTAASGTDTVVGSAGSDVINAKGANDTFDYSANGFIGNDTISGYASAKDAILTDGSGFEVTLGADVRLYTSDDNSLTLKGVGGKNAAVTIDNASYFFGNGTAKAQTFTYLDGGYYYGNSAANAVKVGTDKTKESKTTLGDVVRVDLSDTDHFRNVVVADASTSGNSVYLKAAGENGSTLKGGTYRSTLVGGAGTDSLVGGTGADMFWFDDLKGSDTVVNYKAAQNDAIYLGEELTIVNGGLQSAEVTIKAATSGTKETNVVLANADGVATIKGGIGQAIRFSTDGTTANTVSYYIGKQTVANKFTAQVGSDVVDSKAASDYKAADGTTALNAYNLSSYYVGGTAADTLVLSAVDAKRKKVAVQGAFSLASENLSSIDVLNASGLAGGSTVALIGSNAGASCTLIGSTSASSTERFVIGKATQTIVQNLTGVGDVIELAAGVNVASARQDGKNVIYSLDNGTSLRVDGVALTGKNANIGATATLNTTTNRYEIRRTK